MMMDFSETGTQKERVSANLRRIRRNIASAAERAGRNPKDITIVAVTKKVGTEAIRAAIDCGIGDIGENRVQEAKDKFEKIGNAVNWHFIGHLQKNKVKYIFNFFGLVHSVDSFYLAEEISKRAGQRMEKNENYPLLLQVNIGEEETKHGISPRIAVREAQRIARLPRIRLDGLMAMPPYAEDAENSRPYFRRLMEIKSEIENLKMENAGMNILSFGMTGDYEVAVEEGATHLRIGTGIFGERKHER